MAVGTPIPMKDPGDYIDYEEAEKILASCPSPRDKLIIGLLWRCGLRRFEIGKLKWKFLNDDGTLVVFGKGGHYERIPVEPEIYEMLKDFYLQEDPEGWIFPGYKERGLSPSMINRIVSKYCQISGILVTKSNKKMHPHALRHSLGIWMVKMKVPLPKIQQMLRHTSLVSTTYYLKFSIQELGEDYYNAWKKAKTQALAKLSELDQYPHRTDSEPETPPQIDTDQVNEDSEHNDPLPQ